MERHLSCGSFYPDPALAVARLDAIQSATGRATTYLLECMQDFLDRHGDAFYGGLKHLRNVLDLVCAITPVRTT